MASNTLNDRASGETITADFFNDIHSALDGDLVGRNASGVPTSGQNLGTNALPWGTIRSNSVVVSGVTLDPTLAGTPQNIVKSGKVRSTSNQPAYLIPSGAGATATIDGTPTNLIVDIAGTSVTVSTDISLSGLTLGPSATHTCLVNNSFLTSQALSREYGEGEYGLDYITVDTMGATFSARIGQYVSIKIAGTATEYAYAFVESATKLSRVKRGYFYDSSSNPINRTTIADNAVITLMSTAWVFIQNNGTTTDVSYTTPSWNFTAPGSPATGDYWYDTANSLWKRYDGASWITVNRTLIGMLVLDNTNCVAARCEDFYKNYSNENDIADLNVDSTSIVTCMNQDACVSVAGNRFYWKHSPPSWNITTMLAGSADMYNAAEQASTRYWLYITDTGAFKISDITPYFYGGKRGAYHPHNPWRAVGNFYNNASSNINAAVPEVGKKSKYSARMNTSSTTINDITVTTAIFSATVYDNTGTYNSTTGLWTVPKNGLYQIGGSVEYTGFAFPFENRALTIGAYITREGVTSQELYFPRWALATGVIEHGLNFSAPIYLYAGDTVSIVTYQDSGGNRTLTGGVTGNVFTIDLME